MLVEPNQLSGIQRVLQLPRKKALQVNEKLRLFQQGRQRAKSLFVSRILRQHLSINLDRVLDVAKGVGAQLCELCQYSIPFRTGDELSLQFQNSCELLV